MESFCSVPYSILVLAWKILWSSYCRRKWSTFTMQCCVTPTAVLLSQLTNWSQGQKSKDRSQSVSVSVKVMIQVCYSFTYCETLSYCFGHICTNLAKNAVSACLFYIRIIICSRQGQLHHLYAFIYCRFNNNDAFPTGLFVRDESLLDASVTYG